MSDLTNAVKIKRGKETIIFRTDRAEDKKALLTAFKNVAEELMNKKRKEMLSEAEARKGDVCCPSLLKLPRHTPSNIFHPTSISRIFEAVDLITMEQNRLLDLVLLPF